MREGGRGVECWMGDGVASRHPYITEGREIGGDRERKEIEREGEG